MRILLVLSVLSLLIVLSPVALLADETYHLDDRLDLVLPEPLNLPWVAERVPPEYLVDLTVEHAMLHLGEAGRVIPANLAEQVRSRLGQNELFIINRQTRSHLDIDISRADPGVVAPRRDVVAESARYAESELKNEQDITQLQSSIHEFDLAGVDHAFLLKGDYLQDGEPRRFRGIIGAIGPDWLFLYFTAYQADVDDWQHIEPLLKSARFVKR